MTRPHPRSRRTGFTLIEMSVVMVIVAIAIGGIMVGQEIYHGSQINSVVTDVSRIRAGVSNFRLKYKYFPGDMPDATGYWGISSSCPAGTPGTCDGNGDGHVDDAPGYWTSYNESYRFWQQMGLAGMIQGNFTGIPASLTDTAASAVPGLNTMQHDFNGLYLVSYMNDGLHDGNKIGMWGGDAYARALTGADTQEIDSKIDDGRPMTGTMNNHPASQGYGCYDTTDPVTAKYLLSNPVETCYPQFWLDP